MTLNLGFLGSMGWQELVLILLLVLLLFGAKRLPEVARSIGKSMFEFKKAASDAKKEIEKAAKQEDDHTDNGEETLNPMDSCFLAGGERREMTFLFCDIRGFTHASEASSATDMILFLNSYFADLSELISAHNGVINKFLGDGVLAVYGLDDPDKAVADAFTTAMDIAAHTEAYTLPDGSVPETGVGIHFGTVVAGTVGSEQRYEYTFLGDVVNIASRLEGLSKRLNYRIIVSATAYESLPDEHRAQLTELGLHQVRGKTDSILAYGAVKKPPAP